MVEKKTLVWMRTLKYSGLFDIKGLYSTIDRWLKDHHYDKVERDNAEDVTKEGKQVILVLIPYKKITDYAKVEITMYIEITKMKDEVIERKGLKYKLQRGNIFINFDTDLKTDYEENWETKPFYYFFRTIVDKFIYKGYTKRYETEAVADTKELISEIKHYLNMEQFK